MATPPPARSHLSPAFVATIVLAGAGGCASQPTPVRGAEVAHEEESAVLAAVDRFFEAMASRDTEAYARTQTHDGMTYSFAKRDGAWVLRRRPTQQLIEMHRADTNAIAETYWEPTVLIRGPLAVVWTPYQFRINGAVSHCGVDVFNLLKIDGAWIVANSMWTAEPDACEELAPAAGAQVRPASLRPQ